jgi:hypothetical protein
MTSPRQRKKYAAFLRQKEQEVKGSVQSSKDTEAVKTEKVSVEQPATSVAASQQPVLESGAVAKAKKSKSALVEVKSQDQVVEQTKEEVKTPTGE